MNSTSPDGHVCCDCKWFDGSGCHRLPPQMVPWPNGNQPPITYWPNLTWPLVNANDWCGEWSAAK